MLLLEEPFFERAIALYCNVEKTVAEGAGAASLAALLAYPGAVPRQEVSASSSPAATSIRGCWPRC